MFATNDDQHCNEQMTNIVTIIEHVDQHARHTSLHEKGTTPTESMLGKGAHAAAHRQPLVSVLSVHHPVDFGVVVAANESEMSGAHNIYVAILAILT